MFRWLARLFFLLMLGSAAFSWRDAPAAQVLGLLTFGFLGWALSSFLDFLLTRREFFSQVEAYARSLGVRYTVWDGMGQVWRSVLEVIVFLTLFGMGIGLSILFHSFLYMAFFLLLMVFVGFFYGMRRLSRRRLSLSEAAKMLGLTDTAEDPSRALTLAGEFRGRPVQVRLRRPWVGNSGARTTPAGRSSWSSDRGTPLRVEERTFLAVGVRVPPGVRLFITRDKRKSEPRALLQHLWEDANVQARLRSVLPFVSITLDAPHLLSLYWKEAVTQPVELRFLLDLLCDLAESVESFFGVS